MRWITSVTTKGKETRHVLINWMWSEDILACGRNTRKMKFRERNNSKALKCKKCLRVLKSLIKE